MDVSSSLQYLTLEGTTSTKDLTRQSGDVHLPPKFRSPKKKMATINGDGRAPLRAADVGSDETVTESTTEQDQDKQKLIEGKSSV